MPSLLLLCIIGAAVQHCTAVRLVRCCEAHELLCSTYAAESHMSCCAPYDLLCGTCVAYELLCSISRSQGFTVGGTHGCVRNCPRDKPAELKRVKDPPLRDMDCTNFSYSVDCPVVHEFLTLKILPGYCA